MNKIFSFALALLISLNVAAQSSLDRPKLVVGIVVDQMRWDYLYRFYDLYDKDGGFKRMLDDGFTCENTLIPYLPTYTACGHSSIYTGSVPAINGITGNGWWDYNKMRIVTSVEDDAVNTKGSNTDHGQASPKNLLSTTIGDELRLATNFKSKVIGIALKDRASILPAGLSANAAYWYDKSNGHWIS
ncbi:MAG TPA: alkaline phosphatase family protein, partial [Chitinophagaceae bacterium]|nr:alkaline phosphatase family protein [Chitinophagaceae bacterium]